MASTPEEIREDVSDQLASGVAERQVGDRRVRYEKSKERLEAAALLAAQQSTHGPFTRVGFTSRAF